MAATPPSPLQPLVASLALLLACHPPQPAEPDTSAPRQRQTTAPTPGDTTQRARDLAQRFIIVDGHVDLPYRLYSTRAPDGTITEDISARTPTGNFDLVRAAAGGLDAPFMSIYVPSKHQQDGTAMAVTQELVQLVQQITERWPARTQIVRSVSELRAAKAAGKIALPMGLENGAAIARVADVQTIYDLGIRYVTLTHSKDNALSDASFDDAHTHGGLSPLGKRVVAELGRLGIMVDVSHLSDQAFWQVLEITKVPVIASHSSARHFTPGWERNMSDDMIRALAKNGGVIMVNFGSSFLDDEVRRAREKDWEVINAMLEAQGLTFGEAAAKRVMDDYQAKHPGPRTTVARVADHIDHIVGLVGVDHVGLGSDFDGVGDSLPTGLSDVSHYPTLLRLLLERGYDEEAIQKICGENLLRVWSAVERGG